MFFFVVLFVNPLHFFDRPFQRVHDDCPRGKFWYMQKIKDLLQKNEIPTFIAEPMPGKDIVEITKVRIL